MSAYKCVHWFYLEELLENCGNFVAMHVKQTLDTAFSMCLYCTQHAYLYRHCTLDHACRTWLGVDTCVCVCDHRVLFAEVGNLIAISSRPPSFFRYTAQNRTYEKQQRHLANELNFVSLVLW